MSDPQELYEFSELTLSCITPLHIGCGQDTGVVDLPFVRERATGLPLAPGSGIRGAIRASLEADHPDKVQRLLGLSESAGCISVLDAHVLLFPVRSSQSLFSWVTCPFVLRRYQRARAYFTGEQVDLDKLPDLDEQQFAGGRGDHILLEEFGLARTGDWSFPLIIDDVDKARVVLVSDGWFRYFTQYASTVQQHNRLTAQKTVAGGQLFSVECMPPETVFYGFVGATYERVDEGERLTPAQSRDAFFELLGNGESNAVLTFGGDEGTGAGVTKVTWNTGAAPAARAA